MFRLVVIGELILVTQVQIALKGVATTNIKARSVRPGKSGDD